MCCNATDASASRTWPSGWACPPRPARGAFGSSRPRGSSRVTRPSSIRSASGQTIQAIVQIKLEQHSDEIVERFRRTLIDRPEVLACYTMTGEMDFLLHVIVRDIEALSDFTMRRLLRVPACATSPRPSCSRPSSVRR